MEDYVTHFRKDGQSGDSGYDFRNNTEHVHAFTKNTYSTYVYANLTLDILEQYASNNNANKDQLPFQAVHAL